MLRKWTVLIVAAAISWTGCGDAPEEEVAESLIEKSIEAESGEKAKVEISEGKVSIRTADGDVLAASEDGVEIPEGFPGDVPIYEGAKTVASLKMGDSFQLSLQSKDARSKVVETYKEKMKAEDWELETSMAVGEGDMLHYKKGERRVMLTFTDQDGVTGIALMVQEKP